MIKMLLQAEIDPSSIGKIQSQIKNVQNNTKINVNTTSAVKSVKNLGYAFDGASASTGVLTKAIENAGKFMRFYLVGGALVGFIREIKNGVTSVVELDTSLTELAKVSDLTATQLGVFADKAYEAGKTIGRTGKEVIDATAEFKRAGYEINEAFKLSQQALLLTNIGDGIDDVKEASSSLIAVLKGFKMEAQNTSHIVDALNEVSNNYAVDTNNLTEILKRASGTIGQTGTSFEELLGLATGGFESLRNAEMVASGINMISQRLRGMSENGEAVEGLIPKIQEAFDKYTKGSVSIIDKQNGGLHSTYEILQQLSEIYPTLSDESKAYLNEAIAGNRQNKVLVAILDNWKNVEKSVESATSSLGSASIENQKYLNSIEGKSKQLASSMQTLWKNLINSDVIKMGIDALNGFVNILNNLSNNEFVVFIAQSGLATAAVYGLITAIKMLAGTTVATKFIAMLQLMTSGTLGFSTAVAILSKTLWASPLFKIALITTAIIGAVKVIDAMTVSLKEQKEIVETLSLELQDLQSEYETLLANNNRTKEQEKYLKLLEKELDIKRQILKEETKKAIDKEFFKEYETTVNDAVYNIETGKVEYKDNSGASKIKENIAELIDLQKQLNNTTDKEVYDEIKEKILNIELSLTDSLKTIKNYVEIMGDESPSALKKLEKSIENVILKQDNLSDSTDKVVQSLKSLTETQQSLSSILSTSREEFSDLNDAINSYAENGEFAKDQLEKLIEKYPELIAFLGNEEEMYKRLIEIQDEKVSLAQTNFNKELEILENSINEKLRGYEYDLEKWRDVEQAKLQITSQMVEKVKAKYDEIYGMKDKSGNRVHTEEQAYLHAMKTRKYLGNKIGDALPSIETFINLRDFDVNSYLRDTSKSSSSSTSSKEDYRAESDRYQKINLELDKNNVLLERNRTLQDLAGDDIEKKLVLMEEEIQLNKQRQQSLNALNNERRREMQELEKTLSGQGFKFEGEGDNRIIVNLDNIKGKTKEVEEQFKRYIDLQSNLLPQASQEWWNLQGSISSITMEMSKLEEQSLEDSFNAIREVEDKIIQIIRKRGEIEREELEKTYQEDMEWLEERHKAKLDSYKEELDAFREMIQGQLDELDKQYAEEDYLKNLQKERDKANEIQKQIDTLSLDDSLEARNKVIELRKQLAEQNEKIVEMQTDRERNLLKENLQDQLEDKEQNIKQKEDRENESYERRKRRLEEDYLDSKEDLDRRYSDYAIHVEARKALEEGYVLDYEGKMVRLEVAYKKFEDEFGEGMSYLGSQIKNEFIEKIEDAISAVKKLNSMNIKAGGGGGSSNPLGMSDEDFSKYLQNKSDWESGTNKDSASAENEYLRDKYGIDEDEYSYDDLLKKLKGYDRGGKINYNGLAVVHGEDSPEWILRDHHLKKIISDSVLSTVRVAIPKIPNVTTASNMGNITIGSLIGNVQGNLDKSVIPDLERIAKTAVKDIFEQRKVTLNKRGQFVARA